MKAYLLHILVGAALLCSVTDLAAQEHQQDSSVVTRAVVEGSDTLPIIELPEVFVYERRDFEYLYLKRNKIKSLPDSFMNLQSLEVLHLDRNQIGTLPEWFVR